MPTKMDAEQFKELINNLYTCESSGECLEYAEKLGAAVKENGVLCLSAHGILDQLLAAANNKKSGLEREGGLLGIAGIAKVVGKPVAPYLLPLVPQILELESDKGLPVREAAHLCVSNIFESIDSHGIPFALGFLLEGTNGKWQTKMATLDFLKELGLKYPEEFGECLPDIIPAVSNCMHDTKQEVSTHAVNTMAKLCSVVGNPDIEPHVNLLVDCMAHPDHVTKAVQTISATTFVAEVTGPALALMVPLLVRALNDRSASIMRPTCVIADNLFKLVRNPPDAGQFMPQLLPGLDRIIETAAFPEIRALATAARRTLVNAAGGEDIQSNEVSVDEVMVEINKYFSKKRMFLGGFYNFSKEYSAVVMAHMMKTGAYRLTKWKELLTPLLSPLAKESEVEELIDQLHKHFEDKYKSTMDFGDEDDESEGKLLCDCEFSLAYGGMMLLNNTRLRLRKGQRYGLCGRNGAGKSTLMRAISKGQVEGFPSQDELKCVFVEHKLQGEDAGLSVIDFLKADEGLSNVEKSSIAETLLEVGFTEERQNQPVGALSGGWKMKLELARAMLLKADILLLDEPTNHLDVENIAWLENYLLTHPEITSLIVSHDSSFLDNVCTCITHYENKKLVYYKGNLSKFVERRPEAKSYYTLAATSVKFSFPPPSILLGIRSNTKAILKMSNCTYTYPGAPKPSMYDVSCQLSLSSRVGVVGPNGAGKSTMIKLLTGELIPQEGAVWKHPNIRIGYVAQHAFHHLEQHLEKTPNQYIQWRYQGGQDREVLEKATRKLTDEDLKQMDTYIEFDGIKGKIELLLGRSKLKKSFQYEIKWVGMAHKYNKWIPREFLLEKGFHKLVQAFDDMEASREGQGYRELVPSVIRSHIEEVGLPGDIADYNPISGLSGGQKVKVVLAAAMWNNPHMLVLDEPTNYLDRESLGGLAVAIRNWGGAVIMISHNTEFVEALCPELWHIDAGKSD
jgi:elongation factor 3